MQLKNALIATLLFVAAAFCLGVQPVRASEDAVAYRTNPAHTAQATMPDMAMPLAKLWGVKLAGTIESYPLAAGGHVFVLVSGTSSQISLYALNGVNGSVAWGPVTLPAGVDSAHGAAMAYENGQVFITQNQTSAQGGLMLAYNASTGALTWSATYPGLWWNNDLPTALGGSVYAQQNGIVYSVAEANGLVAWNSNQLDATAGGLAVTDSGLFIAGGCGNAYSLSQANGGILWSLLNSCQNDNGYTPAYYNGDVFVQNFYGAASAAPFPSAAIDAATGTLVQTFPAQGYPAFDNGTMFGVVNNELTATSLSDWINTWTVNDSVNLPATPPTVVNGNVYVATSTGLLKGYDESTGQNTVSLPLGVSTSANQVFGDLQAGDGMILVPSGNQLIAVGSVPGVNPAAIAATHFIVAAASPQVAGTQFTVTVTAENAADQTATNYTGTVAITSSDPNATLPADAVLTNGVGTFSVTLKASGSQTITATDVADASITGFETLNVTAGTVTQFAVLVGPPPPVTTPPTLPGPVAETGGESFSFTVTAEDANGNTVTNYSGSLGFTSTDPATYITLPGDSTLTNGVGTFYAKLWTLGNQTITATDLATSTIKGTSNTVVVVVGATHFVFNGSPTLPGTATAGNKYNFTITAEDSAGDVVLNYTGTVHFTIKFTDPTIAALYTPNAILPTDDTLTAGTGTFSVTFENTGYPEPPDNDEVTATQEIVATDTVTPSITGTSAPVTVVYGPATQLWIQHNFNDIYLQSFVANAGQSFTYIVTARDEYGNMVASYNGPVNVTIGNGQDTYVDTTLTLTNGRVAPDPTASIDIAGNMTITATTTSTPSLTGSGVVDILPGPATLLVVSDTPSTTLATLPFNFTVTAYDGVGMGTDNGPYGNVATGYSGSVHFSSTDTNAAVVLPANSPLINGTKTFSATLVTVGSQTITATDTVTSSITGTSSAITVDSDNASHFIVIPNPSTITAGDSTAVTVSALDDQGLIVTNYSGTVAITSSDPAAVLPASSTLTNGVGTFIVGLKTTGTQTVTATDVNAPSINGVSYPITVNPAPTTHFVVVAPSPETAGTPFNFSVTAEDVYNNITPAYTGTVHFTSSDTNGFVALPLNSTLTNGVGTFSATLITEGSQTITATDSVTPSITGTSNAITMDPAAATHFAVTAPGNVTAGGPFTVTVTALDTYGNVATGYSGTVTLTSTDTEATLPPNSTLTNGVGTFNVTLGTAGNQTVTATDTVSPSINGTSSAITVSAGVATHFVFLNMPTTAIAGTSISFSLKAADSYGNTVTGYTGMVKFTSTDGAAVLPANTTLTGGFGTFSVTFKTVGNRTITATDTVTASITGTSSSVMVNPGAVSTFAFIVPPVTNVGASFQITITARDAEGNLVPSYNGPVDLSLQSPDPIAAFNATPTLVNGSYVGDMTLYTVPTNGSGAAQPQYLIATDPASTSVTGTSAGIQVIPGTATHLVVTAPTTTIEGQSFSFTVEALDQYNNQATAYSGAVHFTSTDTEAMNTPGDLPANSPLANGKATFNATLLTPGNQTITGTDTVTSGITGTSGPIVVVGVVTHFSVVAPSTATAGTPFNATVTALDVNDNTVTDYTGTVAITSSDAKAILPVNNTLTNGVGAFAVTLDTSGNQTVTATDVATPSLSGVSDTIAVSAAPAATLSVVAPSTATAGDQFNVTVTALDAYGNTATGYSGTVAFTSSDSAATLPGSSTLTNGVGTFPATLGTVGNQTITATDTVTSSITGQSNTIAVGSGPATVLKVTAPSTATAGAQFDFTVTAEDSYGNTATGYTGTVKFTSTDAAGSLPASSQLSSGQGTFTATLVTAGTQTITATDTVTPSLTGVSGSIQVSPGAAVNFTVSAPSTATAGTQFNFTVTAKDQYGNVVTGYTGTVAFTSSDLAATLPAAIQLTSGTGTFHATLGTEGSQTITATDSVTPSITGTSGAIVVSHGAMAQFGVTAPSTVTAGTQFAFTVTAEDHYGNTVPGYTGTVKFTSSATSAVLPASSELVNGVANLNATLGTDGNQTITATDTVTPSIAGTSDPINVIASTAVKAFLVTAPSTATAGTAVTVTVNAVDAFGNTVPGYTGKVVFSSSDSKATLPASSTLTNGTGTFQVTFNSVGSETLTAADSVSTTVTGTATVAVSAAVLNTFASGLEMISAPADYSGIAISDYLSPAPELLAIWNTSAYSYVIGPTSPADALRPGVGYWAEFKAASQLLDIGVLSNPATPLSVPLSKGWNMIGDPFTTSVTLGTDVQVVTGDTTESFATATDNGIVLPTLYTYQSGDTQYETVTTALQPYMGYWIYAYSSCTLVISSQ